MYKTATKLTSLFTLLTVFSGCTENAETEEKVTSNNSAPQIVLMGEETIVLSTNDPYIDPGFVAIDSEDGILTSNVIISGDVDTTQAGTYTITYIVSDSNNISSALVTRIVEVTESSSSTGDRGDVIDTTLVPEISSIELVGFTNDGTLISLAEIQSGYVLDLSKIQTDIVNIVANSEDSSATGSVHFQLEGPVAINRVENNPIYTMAIEGQNIVLSNNELPPGSYSLSITPYSQPDLLGEVGTTSQVNFVVTETQEPTSPNTSPTIAAIDLMGSTDEGELIDLFRVTDGMTIDLNTLSTTRINFEAVPLDGELVGSVNFVLSELDSNTTLINRFENNPIYTAEDSQLNLDLSQLAGGTYLLDVKPYSDDELQGESGQSFVITFNLVPYQAPTIFATDDEYVVEANSSLSTDSQNTITLNDTFDDSQFEIQVIESTKNGTLTMDLLGHFIYEPNLDFTGTDQFTYQIAQNGKVAQATTTISVKAAPEVNPSTPSTENPVWSSSTNSSGFTLFEPSSDSKVIYVSFSDGNDSNDCLSQAKPCKNINAGLEKMRKGYPDHVYLKRGDVWRNQTIQNVQSGRSAEQPSVIAFYGDSGPRPKILASDGPLRVVRERDVLKNLSIIGLEFSALHLDPSDSAFDGSTTANIFMLCDNSNILFEDNIFDHTEVIIHHNSGLRPSNIVLRRNIFTGAYANTTSYDQKKRPSNAYLDGIDGVLLEENVFDNGGWHPEVKGASANQFNHNVYMNTNNKGNEVIVRGNIFTRGSSHGIHGRSGGLFEDNFFARNAVGLQMGYNGKPLKAGVRATARNNVITEGKSMYKGVDPCVGGGLCTPAIWGLHITEMGEGIFTLENNIVSDGSFPGDNAKNFYRAGIMAKTDDSAVKYVNNIDWDWSSTADKESSPFVNPGLTLEDYNYHLNGERNFEHFMKIILNRELQKWEEDYSAYAINKFIRDGFKRK